MFPWWYFVAIRPGWDRGEGMVNYFLKCFLEINISEFSWTQTWMANDQQLHRKLSTFHKGILLSREKKEKKSKDSLCLSNQRGAGFSESPCLLLSSKLCVRNVYEAETLVYLEFPSSFSFYPYLLSLWPHQNWNMAFEAIPRIGLGKV